MHNNQAGRRVSTSSGVRRSLHAVLLLGTMLGGTLTTSALAQITPPSFAYKRPVLDTNGVDVISGQFTIVDKQVGIGNPADGGLSFRRIWSDNGWYHNMVGTVSSGGTNKLIVRVGEAVESFTAFVSDDGTGSTLSFNVSTQKYTYTTSDGTVMIFENPAAAVYAYGGDKGLLLSITRPSGLVTNFYYKYQVHCLISELGPTCAPQYVVRLQSVTTNAGYQLKFAYFGPTSDPSKMETDLIPYWSQIKSVTALNNSVDYCNPAASGACTGTTQTWPRITLATAVSGQIQTDTLTYILNNTTTTTMNSGKLEGIQRPGSPNNDFSLIYDGSGRVATLVKAGATWTYGYADVGSQRTTTVAQPLGGTEIYVSNMVTRQLLSVTNALGKTILYQYDVSGRLIRQTSPEGNYTQYTYDARGNVTEQRAVSKALGTPPDLVTTASFPAACTNVLTCNQPIWTKDSASSQTDYTYDSATGLVTSVKLPAPASGGVRPEIRYGYSALYAWYKNSAGTIVQAPSPITKLTSTSTCQTTASCAATADEVKTTVSYQAGSTSSGSNLFPVSVTRGSGDGSLTASTAITYDAVGNVLTVDGPLAGAADTVRYRYDAGRQLVGIVSPDPDGVGALRPRAQRLGYNADGQIVTVETGTVNSQSDGDWAAMTVLQTMTSSYDANARKLKDVLSAGGTAYSVKQYGYDAVGRLECTAQRMNPAVFGSLPASACTLGTAGSFGPDRIAKTIYDAAGQVTKVQSALGTADQADDVTTTYTSNGRAATVTDAEGSKTTYEYDGFDRLAKTRYPLPATPGSSSTTDYEQLTYDAAGNVTQRRLRDGQTIAYTYDALNRLTLKDVPNVAPYENDIAYTYDNLGRVLTAAGTSGTTRSLSYGYDALSRMTRETTYLGSKTLAYDAAGQQTRLTWQDGFYVNYDYLVTGEMTKVRENGTISGIGVLATYAYDDLGRRTSLTRGNGTVTSYGYDAVSRLTSLADNLTGTAQDQTLGFSYNPAGQIVTNTRSNDSYAWTQHYNVDRPYTVNGLNQMTQAGSTTLGYDGRGNLTTSGTTTYQYTSENRLAAVPGISPFLPYDSIGQLVQISPSGGPETNFDYQNGQLIAEHDQVTYALQRRYVHGAGVDEPLVWYEGSGTTDRRWLHVDERGSIVAVSDAGGNALAVNSYDEYGIPASTNIGRFQYTGQTWLPEVGLYYYKARIYSPTLGRFMQTDPIGYSDGMNWYNYVRSDPVNGRDPSGMCNKQVLTGSRIPQCLSEDGRGGYVAGGHSPTPSTGHGGGVHLGNFVYIPGSPGSVTFDGTQSTVTASIPGQWMYTGSNGSLGSWGTISENNHPPGTIIVTYYTNRGPTFGVLDQFNNSRGVMSHASGGYDQALRDLDELARWNGLTPLGDKGLLNGPPAGWFIAPISNGVRIFTSSGFQMRVIPGNVRIDIPPGFRVGPSFTDTSNFGETVHYGP